MNILNVHIVITILSWGSEVDCLLLVLHTGLGYHNSSENNLIKHNNNGVSIRLVENIYCSTIIFRRGWVVMCVAVLEK